ncbi:conserved hypothetical protein [Burkholderia latens]
MARCLLHRHDEYRDAKPSATFRGPAIPLGVFHEAGADARRALREAVWAAGGGGERAKPPG